MRNFHSYLLQPLFRQPALLAIRQADAVPVLLYLFDAQFDAFLDDEEVGGRFGGGAFDGDGGCGITL